VGLEMVEIEIETDEADLRYRTILMDWAGRRKGTGDWGLRGGLKFES